MTNPIKNRANTIFIHVSNLEKSVIWYSKLLNQQVDAADISRPVYNLAMNQYTGITLDAGPSGTTKEITPLPYPLFNFHTEDIYEAYQHIKKFEYKIVSEIVEFDDFAYFNIIDPDGNIIMICNG
ncbi:VOC family protein [Oceanobacillus jeddahense]|uniref:VOC family protein n=1 Tax=Oceanobacillus jeddahense TaxID=1462527 RepID=A0ABY5JUW7_9BACI|nr:VOC family protein [Oceanobacillus jeddahense]UUI03589.1 VOC family protein [Oceanobacillus jeddahense]